MLLKGKSVTNLNSLLKNKENTLLTKVCIVKAIIFPVDKLHIPVGMDLSKVWEIVKDREAWRAAVHGITMSRAKLRD